MSSHPSERAKCARCGITRTIHHSRPRNSICRDCTLVLSTEELEAWAA